MNSKTVIGGIILLIVVLGAVWYVVQSQEGELTSIEDLDIGARDGALTLASLENLATTTLDGESADLADYAGKPLVINAWASWCPFCVDELPAFAAIQRELGDSVTIIAIDRGEPASVAMQYINRLEISDDLVWLLDQSDSFYARIGGFSMPETLFFNSDGSLGFHKRGPMEADEIKQRIERLN